MRGVLGCFHDFSTSMWGITGHNSVRKMPFRASTPNWTNWSDDIWSCVRTPFWGFEHLRTSKKKSQIIPLVNQQPTIGSDHIFTSMIFCFWKPRNWRKQNCSLAWSWTIITTPSRLGRLGGLGGCRAKLIKLGILVMWKNMGRSWEFIIHEQEDDM